MVSTHIPRSGPSLYTEGDGGDRGDGGGDRGDGGDDQPNKILIASTSMHHYVYHIRTYHIRSYHIRTYHIRTCHIRTYPNINLVIKHLLQIKNTSSFDPKWNGVQMHPHTDHTTSHTHTHITHTHITHTHHTLTYHTLTCLYTAASNGTLISSRPPLGLYQHMPRPYMV